MRMGQQKPRVEPRAVDAGRRKPRRRACSRSRALRLRRSSLGRLELGQTVGLVLRHQRVDRSRPDRRRR